jgi:hypothetical protein
MKKLLNKSNQIFSYNVSYAAERAGVGRAAVRASQQAAWFK